MARIEDIERRLQNWARWKHGAGSGGLGYGSNSMGASASGARYRESVIPTVDCEAEQTDRAVTQLENRLRATVYQVYLTGDSARIDAVKLGCTESAVKARVWDAHRCIDRWLSEQRASADAERVRVERLQREAVR